MKVLVIEDNQQVVKDISFCLQVRYPEALSPYLQKVAGQWLN